MSLNLHDHLPEQSQSNSRSSSIYLKAIILISAVLGSCTLHWVLANISYPANPPRSSTTAFVPTSSPFLINALHQDSSTPGKDKPKYFNGDQACLFLATVNGLKSGPYKKQGDFGDYGCGREREIRLSCAPTSRYFECNKVAYSVSGEEQGATTLVLIYRGHSWVPSDRRPDLERFIRYCEQLARQALGAELDSEVKQAILDTRRYLPVDPKPNAATVERHILKRQLGSGFITLEMRRFGRARNDLLDINDRFNAARYYVSFRVYADEQWSKK